MHIAHKNIELHLLHFWSKRNLISCYSTLKVWSYLFKMKTSKYQQPSLQQNTSSPLHTDVESLHGLSPDNRQTVCSFGPNSLPYFRFSIKMDQMSTNKCSIGPVVLETAPWVLSRWFQISICPEIKNCYLYIDIASIRAVLSSLFKRFP